MSTHNICLYEEVDKKYTGCNLKTTKLLDFVLIEVCARALEILKSESVQPMTMTSSMSPFPKKKLCIYHLSRKLMTIGSPITPFK